MRRLRVALGQINATVGDFERNVRMIVDAIERARALGVELVAFPELAITGYPPEDLLLKPSFIEANLRALDEVTRAARGLTVVVGFVDARRHLQRRRRDPRRRRAGVYHKHYLPNYGVFDENRYFQAGTETPVFVAGDIIFGVNVCEDIWYPGGPTAVQVLGGAEIIVNMTARRITPARPASASSMMSTRAADNLVCVGYVNLVGGQDELVFDGGSLIVDEHGECSRAGECSRRTSSSPTSTSTPSSGPACTTRGGARNSSRPERRATPRSRCRRFPSPTRRRCRRATWPRSRRSRRCSGPWCSARATTCERTGSSAW